MNESQINMNINEEVPQFCHASCQTGFLFKKPPPTIAEVLRNDTSICACTGLSSMIDFQKLCESVTYMLTAMNIETKFKLDVECRVLLTLMKLKLDLSFRCLSCFFHISEPTTAEYFFCTLDILHCDIEAVYCLAFERYYHQQLAHTFSFIYKYACGC